jgi:polyisoprenoid-binding protein YceI
MTAPGELTGDYVLDAAGTRIGFVARHAMATRVRGHFERFDGSGHLDDTDPSKSWFRLTIQATSIQTRNQRRDDQLRSSFLNVDDHPALTFTSTRVHRLGDTLFEVAGDLIIRGVTRPVTMNLVLVGPERDPRGDLRVVLKGGVTIDRNGWGVNWNGVTRVMVSPKVTVELDVTAVRRF